MLQRAASKKQQKSKEDSDAHEIGELQAEWGDYIDTP
jgi:hypothetical protein